MFNKATRFDHLGHHEANARDTRHKKEILIIVQRDATQSSLFIVLQGHSACFGCQPHSIRSTQNCNYSLRYCAATSLQRGQASLATLEGGSCTTNMTSTAGCSYSFVYS